MWDTTDDGGACNRIGREIFSDQTVNIEDATAPGGYRACSGLSFETNITGQSVQKNPDKPQKGYKCEYRVDVKLLNGGTGWKKGDVVTVEASEEKYEITVDEVSTRKVKNLLFAADHTTPADGATVVKAIDILNALKESIETDGSAYNMTAEVIGNGCLLYTSPSPRD